MAESEPLSIRGIHWRDALPFTNLFRAFRVAIHPSKVVLALAALLMLYAAGHALDWVWPVADRAVADEVGLYEQFTAHPAAGRTFANVRRDHRAALESTYAQQLLADKIVSSPAAAKAAAPTGEHLGEVKAALLEQRQKAVDAAEQARAAALRGTPDATARRAADDAYRASVRAAYDTASADYAAARRIRNDGLFDAFFEYESNQVSYAVEGVRAWNWFGDRPANPSAAGGVVNPLGDDAGGSALMAAVEQASAARGGPFGSAAAPAAPGIVPSVTRFFAVGPVWLLTQHTVYFLLFGLVFLVVWSVFGGAIARIAAVHVARDEKLSIRSALVFSVGKFLSFLCAPLIPLGFLAAIGGLTALVSLVLTVIPGLGSTLGVVVLGLGFVLALVAGLAMAVLLVGLVGGFNLMYPTIAVEGSDSFDAISRSFSYLYARPWRLALYTAMAVVYGSACYMFVKLFIWLVLSLTHHFVALGILTHTASTAPLLSALWPDPATAGRLSYNVDALSLTVPQEVAAGLIWFWVHLVIAILGAFAVTFYFSANTIIYYLLRQEVDATDLNDVYVDPSDEDEDPAEPDPTDPVPAAKPAAAPPASSDAIADPTIAPAAAAADGAPPS